MKRFMNPFTVIIIALLFATSITSGRFSNPGQWFMSMLLMLPGLLIGLSLHEFAHAAVAYKLGDPTSKNQDRVTINPAAHIDPLGFFSLMLVGFGWGRPVQINPANFKNPRRDEILVSLSGVTMNFIVALLSCGIYIFLMSKGGYPTLSSSVLDIVTYIVLWIVQINVVLMVFNLLPVPPLDGFSIITELFNLRRYNWYYTVYNNGLIILLALIVFGITGVFLSGGINVILSVIEKFWSLILF